MTNKGTLDQNSSEMSASEIFSLVSEAKKASDFMRENGWATETPQYKGKAQLAMNVSWLIEKGVFSSMMNAEEAL